MTVYVCDEKYDREIKTLSSLPLRSLTPCAMRVGFYGSSQVALRCLCRKIVKHVISVLICRKKKGGTKEEMPSCLLLCEEFYLKIRNMHIIL